MKHLKSFNESFDIDKLSKFHREYERLCKVIIFLDELWSEIGQLILKYNLTKDDVLYILNNFNCNFDVNEFLRDIYENWDFYKNWEENEKLDIIVDQTDEWITLKFNKKEAKLLKQALGRTSAKGKSLDLSMKIEDILYNFYKK